MKIKTSVNFYTFKKKKNQSIYDVVLTSGRTPEGFPYL